MLNYFTIYLVGFR